MPCGLAIRSLASNLLVASSSRSPSSSSFVAHRVGRAYKSYSTETTSSVFPACGRKRGVSHGSLVVMASLPQGKGAAELVAQSCAALGACSRETPKLAPEEVEEKMGAVPLWRLNEDKTAISRSFTAKNWQGANPNHRQCALDFINGMSAVAEEEGHHPDFHLTNYRDVRVDVTTHAIGGLSLHDFVLAAKLDMIEVTYSPKWVRENSAPAEK